MENKNINKKTLNNTKLEKKISSDIESIENIDSSNRKEYIIETEFKGSRKAYFSNPKAIPLKVGEHIIVDFDNGEDMGIVSQIINLNLKKTKEEYSVSGIIIRKGNQIDGRRLRENRDIEDKVLIFARKEAVKQKLEMKFLDIEYKFDRKKLVFYFTADGRIDFRSLVKSFASEYKTRIELKQIGVRDEAQRIGGIGVCGRELCCSKFLNSFVSINVAMARDQNLFVKPEKFSGQCGKLMCCLKFEHEFYLEEKKGLPELGATIKFKDKTAIVNMINVFDKSITLYYTSGETVVHPKDEFIELMKNVKEKDIISRNGNSNYKDSSSNHNNANEKATKQRESKAKTTTKNYKKNDRKDTEKDSKDKFKNRFNKNVKNKHHKKVEITKDRNFNNKNNQNKSAADQHTSHTKNEKETEKMKHNHAKSVKQKYNRKIIKEN